MSIIKAIETRYKGYHFRSRLEARWAVFFDALNEPWQYESEGYDLYGVYYLPDFWLPRLGVFMEIKGINPSADEFLKMAYLREGTGHATTIFHGLPGEYWGKLYCWDQGEGSAGSSDWDISLTSDIDGELLINVNNVRDHQISLAADWSKLWCLNDSRCATEFLEPAIEQAKSARFEHDDWRA